MKNCIGYTAIALLVAVFAAPASAQRLADVYRSGTLRIVPDRNYAAGNDWKTIFADYEEALRRRLKPEIAKDLDIPIELPPRYLGKQKDMVIAGDGTIFVANRSTYDFHIFNRSGNYIKTFGGEGKGGETFRNRATLLCAYRNEYIITKELNGLLKMFDTDGSYLRTVQLEYPVSQAVALSPTKIAMSGSVMWSNPYRWRPCRRDPGPLFRRGADRVLSVYQRHEIV